MYVSKISDFEVVDAHLPFFYKIFDPNLLRLNLPAPFFEREKRYRQIKGYEVNGQKFYIKTYTAHFEEAEAEWENLLKLKTLGFSVPEPFFRHKSFDKVKIATFALKGVPLSSLIPKSQQNQENLLYRLAELISRMHLKNFFHQDCYLNHFFWDEHSQNLGFLDVSRVIKDPKIPLSYQIKDLGQLGYSFEEYFGNSGPILFEKFLSYYLGLVNQSSKGLLKFLVKLKVWLIRRRTLKAKKRGKKL